MPVLPVIAILLVLAGCSISPSASKAGHAIEVSQETAGYLVREAGRPVLFYQLEPRSIDGSFERSNYVHPLYGLDGEILTEDFPKDHRHHRGVYWTWHQVLIGEIRAGDPWLAQRFSWQLEDARVLPAGNGLRLTHRWFSPDFAAGSEPIAEEIAEVVVHPEASDIRFVDFDIRLAALQEDLRLGGSEDEKGYGGFSVRVRVLEDLRFTAASGGVIPQRLAMDVGDWVDFSAAFGGAGTASGVAVFVHPSSAGYPQGWVLRASATPSMQNPVWPGPAPVSVPMGEPVRLRYRLVIHRGAASSVSLQELSKAYAATP